MHAINGRGVIAEHYHDLQSLGLIERARAERSVAPATPESLVRTLLQAAELALYNATDVLERAGDDLCSERWESCATKLAWARGFHRVLLRLSLVCERYSAYAQLRGLGLNTPGRINESPAGKAYFDAAIGFGRRLEGCMRSVQIDPLEALANDGLSSPRFAILHLARIISHDSAIWERNLLASAGPPTDMDYGAFTASAVLREAVYEHDLVGDTYFTQFRGLHQIPELVSAEINDRLEHAILALHARNLGTALEDLVWSNALAEVVAACLAPMVDNLTTHDYHEIRENLGLTSGSHSVGLRFHMFTDLYEQLCDAVGAQLNGGRGEQVADTGVVGNEEVSELAWLLIGQLMSFRSFIFQWRDEHLHLPRNNLGGASTRSLTGSADAVQVVANMAEHARNHDPARRLFAGSSAEGDRPRPLVGSLTEALRAPGSIDDLLLTATGRITQSKFTHVQDRSGFFANKCPFTKPPRRVVSPPPSPDA